MRIRQLSGDRFAIWLLHRLGMLLWGFPPRLMPALVHRLGAFGVLYWFARNMLRYERTRRIFGSLRTHLLGTTVSLINDCEYCAFGSAYALELIYLRDHGRLFPLTVAEILQLRGRDPAVIRDQLAAALMTAGLPDEEQWLDRLLVVTSGQAYPRSPDDARLAHLVGMFGVLNECGIIGQVTPDGVHDPVNKDSQLKRTYHRLRAQPD
ncbi:MAG: hypothetical protein ACRDTG_33045 [Pseudonocardiaceae bacterium]